MNIELDKIKLSPDINGEFTYDGVEYCITKSYGLTFLEEVASTMDHIDEDYIIGGYDAPMYKAICRHAQEFDVRDLDIVKFIRNHPERWKQLEE